MRRLALDCSGDLRSAAVGDDSVCVAIQAEAGARSHAERLVPLVQATLAEAGWTWRDVAEIALAVGPGSFTGVRLAVAAGRALALSLDVPIRPVTSLHALLADDDAEVAAIDARRGGLYVGVRRADTIDVASHALTVTDALHWIGERAIVAKGSGAAQLVAAAVTGSAIDAPVRADRVLRAAATAAVRGEGAQAGNEVRPLYLRGADAMPQAA